MIGVEVDGDLRAVAPRLAQVDEVDYVVVTTGRFDLLVEVVCRDNEELLRLINDVIRAIPGVRATEMFTLPAPREADVFVGDGLVGASAH